MKIAIFLFFLFLMSCMKNDKTSFIAPELRGILALDYAELGIDQMNLWHELSGSHLWVKDISRFNTAVQQDSFYLVSFKDKSELFDLVSASDSLVLRDISLGDDGVAILKNPKEQEILALAAASHTQKSQSLPCGATVKLMPLRATRTIEYVPPIYDESIYLDEVQKLLNQTSKDKLIEHISFFEAMGTRFHAAANQEEVSARVLERIRSLTLNIPSEVKSISEVEHVGSYQKSIVVTLLGSQKPDEKVIFGAHLDSINSHISSHDGPAPGADDDASGLATLLEMLRIINDLGGQFERTLEFHAYAAEEIGLIGSGELAAQYQNEGVKVAGMMQFDMTAYSSEPGKNTIFLVDNNTSPFLRRATKDLLHRYLGGDFVEKKLPSGKSDYFSWDYQGYPAVFPFEDPEAYNPLLHSAMDTSLENNNLVLAERFVGLGLAFAGHFAGIISGKNDYENTFAEEDLNGDIKIFLKKSGNTSNYELFVATDKDTEHAEYCLAEDDKNTCSPTSERKIMVNIDQTASRRFFAGELSSAVLSLDTNQRILLFAYDNEDKLLRRRYFSLQRP